MKLPKPPLWSLPPLAGALWVLCFPKPGLGWLAWAALVPLFVFLERAPRWTDSALGAFAAGAVFHLGLMHWIYATCRTAGVSASVSLAAWAGLALVMSLNWALFGAGVHGLRSVFGFAPPGILAAAWTAMEWLTARWTTRFPWCLAGTSQWENGWLLPAAGMAGVYGLGFVLIMVNATLAGALGGGRAPRAWLPTAAVAAGMLGLGLALGPRGAPEPDVEIAILQGGVDQYKKWDDQYEREILETYAALAEGSKGSPLVLWPESALPGWLEDERYRSWLEAATAKGDNYHLVGIVSRQGGEPKNSAVLVGPEGRLLGFYHKRQLVPFGERVPLQRLLGAWVPVLGELGGFSPGPSRQEPLDTVLGRVVVGICYEAAFPHLMRHGEREGARLLVNLTNDGWYLDTAGPYQHFAMSVLRAAENRAYLFRAANTGISAVVDPFGRVSARTKLGEKVLFKAKYSHALAHAAPSPYALLGDLFPALCLAGCLSAGGLGWLEKSRGGKA